MPPVQASAAKGHIFADGTWAEVFTPISSRIPTRSSLRSIGSQVDSPTRTSTSSLRSHGLRAVIVIGMRANTCIESTVRFAAELGYEVTVVKDAIGSFGHAEMDASLQFNIPAYASSVVSTDEIVATLSVTSTAEDIRKPNEHQ